eukprot:9916599-Alexandrium_andersonii.AAC.1
MCIRDSLLTSRSRDELQQVCVPPFTLTHAPARAGTVRQGPALPPEACGLRSNRETCPTPSASG